MSYCNRLTSNLVGRLPFLLPFNLYKVITDKRRNPTSRTELELQRILLRLKKSGNLTESEYWRLRPLDSYSLAFYGLPSTQDSSD